MHGRSSPSGYGGVAMLLHWLTVAAVLIAWLLGTLGDDLPRGATRAAGLSIHIAAGLMVLGLTATRLPWRLFDRPSSPEITPLGAWVTTVAELTHLGLYALLIVTPIVGIVLQFARGDALPVFGVIEVGSPWVRDRAFAGSVKEVHEILANLLMIVACLHAAAALIHHWLLRDRTLTRMLPGLHR